MLEKLKHISFFKLFRNLYFLMRYNIYDLKVVKNEVLILNIFNYYREFPELKENFQAELSYLLINPEDIIFPYKQLKRLETVQSGYDQQRKLPFVMHENKKLFFPKTWTADRVVSTYMAFIENENILGGNYKEKSPHQYETDNFCVNENDVLMDIGSAEGLFALHVINRVKKIYLIESDTLWIEALNATFEPYKEKVEIINKLISDTDTVKTITLSSILINELTSSLFIKMDIEGYETIVLNASKNILSQNLNVKIACCTYHNQTDAETLTKIFTSMDYEVEFSDGYILYTDDKLMPPYFRKGVIRAKKCKKY